MISPHHWRFLCAGMYQAQWLIMCYGVWSDYNISLSLPMPTGALEHRESCKKTRIYGHICASISKSTSVICQRVWVSTVYVTVYGYNYIYRTLILITYYEPWRTGSLVKSWSRCSTIGGVEIDAVHCVLTSDCSFSITRWFTLEIHSWASCMGGCS